jgi:hypothetical protein
VIRKGRSAPGARVPVPPRLVPLIETRDLGGLLELDAARQAGALGAPDPALGALDPGVVSGPGPLFLLQVLVQGRGDGLVGLPRIAWSLVGGMLLGCRRTPPTVTPASKASFNCCWVYDNTMASGLEIVIVLALSAKRNFVSQYLRRRRTRESL